MAYVDEVLEDWPPDWLQRQTDEIIADQEARPRKWQDEWYKRMIDCMAEPPDMVRNIGRCREPKNHEGAHIAHNYWHRFTWESTK